MCATVGHVSAKPPNVLFLFTDDQRADTIHALGNDRIRTPNIDRLVRSGLVFTNAYCMGGHVAAVCITSRTMLMSGLSMFRIGQWREGSPSLPRSMREAGYETYHHGKRGNVPLEIQKAFEHNFYLDDEKDRTCGQPGKEIAGRAVEFLRGGRDKARPFFMYLAFANPHDPRVVTEEYRKPYEVAALPLPKNFLPFHPFDNGELLVRDEKLAPWPRTPEVIRQHLADYYGVITYLDEQIGRILDALKESGEYENTIIIFSSDHGLALGSHGLMGKQSLYEDAMKAPLIVAGPGIAPGTPGKSDALVYLHDLYPTICQLTGATVPDGLDARSLAPILHGKSQRVCDALFTAYRDVQRAVRDERWKLIYYPKIERWQLFDLQRDPEELNDRSVDPKQAARLAAMKETLSAQQKELGDPLAKP